MKVRMLQNCIFGYYKEGEIAEVLENDFDKYDYKLNFGSFTELDKNGKPVEYARIVYAYTDEVEIINETRET